MTILQRKKQGRDGTKVKEVQSQKRTEPIVHSILICPTLTVFISVSGRNCFNLTVLLTSLGRTCSRQQNWDTTCTSKHLHEFQSPIKEVRKPQSKLCGEKVLTSSTNLVLTLMRFTASTNCFAGFPSGVQNRINHLTFNLPTSLQVNTFNN